MQICDSLSEQNAEWHAAAEKLSERDNELREKIQNHRTSLIEENVSKFHLITSTSFILFEIRVYAFVKKLKIQIYRYADGTCY